MTENEKKLFDAIAMRKVAEIEKIINAEKENCAKGHPRTINPAAVNENGDGYAHLAAKWNTDFIVKKIVFDLGADLTLKDKQDKLPMAYAWTPPFTAAVKKIEDLKNGAKIAPHQQQVQKIVEVEAKNKAYTRGIVYTNNFSLFYKAKPEKPHKQCVIPDCDPETGLTIHDQQAISKAFVAQGVDCKVSTQLSGKVPKLVSTNFVLANIGCVITDIPHRQNGNHKRIFITAPILFNNAAPQELADKPHSEVFLVDHILSNDKNFKNIIKDLLTKHGVTLVAEDKFERRKIYSLIIDLHSSQDMCDDCADTVLKFQNNHTYYLKSILLGMGLNVPSKSDRFKILFRVSAKRPPSSSEYRQELHLRDAKKEFAREHTHATPMDINRSATVVILHSDEKMRDSITLWTKPARYSSLPFFTLSARTVFVNQTGILRNEATRYVMPIEDFKKEIHTAIATKEFKEELTEQVISFLVPIARM